MSSSRKRPLDETGFASPVANEPAANEQLHVDFSVNDNIVFINVCNIMLGRSIKHFPDPLKASIAPILEDNRDVFIKVSEMTKRERVLYLEGHMHTLGKTITRLKLTCAEMLEQASPEEKKVKE